MLLRIRVLPPRRCPSSRPRTPAPPQVQALQQAVDRTAAQVRALLPDLSGLKLEPDEADLAELRASGYVGEVAAQLQALQADPARSAVAGEALRLLLRFQREGAAAGGAQ